MTADIELLPLPKWLLDGFTDPTIEMLCDYTRANVEHYVKELQEEVSRARGLWGDAETHCHKLYAQNAAKDAVIEALRAEVERLQAGLDTRWATGEHTCHDKCQRIACVLRRDNKRLAEALRECVKDMQRTEDYYGEHPEAQEVISKARAALRDHDQEDDNG